MTLFEDLRVAVAGFDSDLRHPGVEVVDFTDKFDGLVARLKSAYSLDEKIFSQEETVKRSMNASKMGTYSPEEVSVNTLRTFLKFTKYDAKKVENSFAGENVDLGVIKLSAKKIQGGEDQIKFHRDGIVTMLAHKVAKLEMLLNDGEKGIPEAYATAFTQARKEVSILRDAAKLAMNWDRSWGRFDFDSVVEKAHGRWTKGVVKKGVLAGAFVLASCSATSPVDVKPNSVSTLPDGGGKPTEQTGVKAIGTETPIPNDEFLSPIDAIVENMNSERMVKLEKQYRDGTVYGYDYKNGKDKVKTLTRDEKKEAQVLTGWSLVTQDGAKSEFVMLTSGQIVRNGGNFMTNLTEKTVDQFTVIGEHAKIVDSGLNFPTDEQKPGEGAFMSWIVYDPTTKEMWMLSDKDNKLHPVDQGKTVFKNAIPIEVNDMFERADEMVDDYGSYVPVRNASGVLNVVYENGLTFELKNGELVYVQPEPERVPTPPVAEISPEAAKILPEFQVSFPEQIKDLQKIEYKELEYLDSQKFMEAMVWAVNHDMLPIPSDSVIPMKYVVLSDPSKFDKSGMDVLYKADNQKSQVKEVDRAYVHAYIVDSSINGVETTFVYDSYKNNDGTYGLIRRNIPPYPGDSKHDRLHGSLALGQDGIISGGGYFKDYKSCQEYYNEIYKLGSKKASLLCDYTMGEMKSQEFLSVFDVWSDPSKGVLSNKLKVGSEYRYYIPTVPSSNKKYTGQ